MLNRLKKIWFLPERITDLEQSAELFYLQDKVTTEETQLMRHLLGSIDLSDIVQPPTKPAERKQYVSEASVAFKNVLEPMLKRFIKAQEEWMARYSDGEKQFLVGRGTINGLFLIFDELSALHNEHLANLNPEKPEVESNKIYGEIE